MLDVYEEREFLPELSLPLQENRGGKLHFRCVYCGDSKRSKTKKRAWIIEAHDRLMYRCYNCDKSIYFRTFLKDQDSALFKKYRDKERIKKLKEIKKGNFLLSKKPIFKIEEILESKVLKYIKFDRRGFIPLKEHLPAYEYCHHRQIPAKVMNSMFWCKVPPTAKVPYGEQIIFPFYNDKKIYGFQGRAIEGKHFHTFMENESMKVYNVFGINYEDPTYIFESIIDSFAIENSLGMLGASLSDSILRRLRLPIFVFDNDRTGYEKALKYCNDGHKVVIWPNYLNWKDPNAMLVRGKMTAMQVKSLIIKNVKEGMEARIALELKLMKTKK